MADTPESNDITPKNHRVIDSVVRLLTESESILFITGAGISADSGLPTYRGASGLYNDLTDEGVPIEQVMSGEYFRARPGVTWKYLLKMAQARAGATHNRAHEVLALMERRFPRTLVLTQNIDGFHKAAGSTRVIDIHGDARELVCTSCPWRQPADVRAILAGPLPPRCPNCGEVVRPNVVLFGELLDPAKVERMQAELAERFDLVFSIGTTSAFPYIIAPVLDAARRGVATVEINPGPTEVSHLVAYKIAAPAAAALDAIWRRFEEVA